MKKNLILFVAILLVGTSFGQTLSTGVISGAAGGYSASGNSITWILGQIATGSSTSSQGQLSQGFIPGYLIIEGSSSIYNLTKSFTVNVYPNPTVNDVILETQTELDIESENLSVSIYDIQGKKLHHQDINSNKEILNFSKYPVSVYLMKIEQNNTIIKTIKITKNN